jgi:hypothetical protein
LLANGGRSPSSDESMFGKGEEVLSITKKNEVHNKCATTLSVNRYYTLTVSWFTQDD